MLDFFTNSTLNCNGTVDFTSPLNTIKFAKSIIERGDISRLNASSVNSIADANNKYKKNWMLHLITEYEKATTKDTLSESFLTQLLSLKIEHPNTFPIFTSFIEKTGALSPHNVNHVVVEFLKNEEITPLLTGYNQRHNTELMFSKATEEALAKRKQDL